MVPIDAEIAAMAKAMVRGFEVSPETLMGEAIERVGIAGNFLTEKETRRRVRQGEHFVPWIASRQPLEQWQSAGKSEVDAANLRIDGALAARAQRAPYLTDEQRRELALVCGLTAAEVAAWS
jgi:trimethylamine:corrinoid methyltransferase-like protein